MFVVVRYAEHHLFGDLVPHILCRDAGLRRAVSPMPGVIREGCIRHVSHSHPRRRMLNYPPNSDPSSMTELHNWITILGTDKDDGTYWSNFGGESRSPSITARNQIFSGAVAQAQNLFSSNRRIVIACWNDCTSECFNEKNKIVAVDRDLPSCAAYWNGKGGDI